jgi:hypothetical protein
MVIVVVARLDGRDFLSRGLRLAYLLCAVPSFFTLLAAFCVLYTKAQPYLTLLYPAKFGIRVAFGVAMRSTWVIAFNICIKTGSSYEVHRSLACARLLGYL